MEWLEKKFDHWNPEEEYRRYLLTITRRGGQLGSFPLTISSCSASGPSTQAIFGMSFIFFFCFLF